MASSLHPLPAPDVEERLRAQYGDDIASVADRFGHVEVVVKANRYREVITLLRDDRAYACDFFDFLTAVDRPAEGVMEVVVHVYSTQSGAHVRVKTAIPREDPHIPTISDLYPGANWAEREVWELFGIVVDGHPHLLKLLLPEPFDGFPLRKDFELMSRVAKPWPGAAEGEEVEDE